MRLSGELAALATALCWTITALSFEVAGKRIGSLTLNLLRLVAAIFLLALWSGFQRGLPFPTDASGHTWLWLSVSGVVGFAVGDLCLFRAFVVIGSRLSMLLMALVPPFTALIGWLVLGESLAGRDWLGMALTLVGVAWVVRERPSTSDEAPSPSTTSFTGGILLGLGGAVGQAAGLVLSKHGMGSYDAFAATQIRVLAGSLCFALLFTVIRWWSRVRGAFEDRRGLAFTALGSFFGPFLGVSLSLLAVQHTQAGVAATIMSLTPVLIIPASALLLRERISVAAAGAALVAVAGSALLFL